MKTAIFALLLAFLGECGSPGGMGGADVGVCRPVGAPARVGSGPRFRTARSSSSIITHSPAPLPPHSHTHAPPSSSTAFASANEEPTMVPRRALQQWGGWGGLGGAAASAAAGSPGYWGGGFYPGFWTPYGWGGGWGGWGGWGGAASSAAAAGGRGGAAAGGAAAG